MKVFSYNRSILQVKGALPQQGDEATGVGIVLELQRRRRRPDLAWPQRLITDKTRVCVYVGIFALATALPYPRPPPPTLPFLQPPNPTLARQINLFIVAFIIHCALIPI